MTGGSLDTAESQVAKLDALFPNNRRVTAIRGQLAAKQREVREQGEVEEFLRLAQQQMDDGKLIEPESDNALESYTQVLNRQTG